MNSDEQNARPSRSAERKPVLDGGSPGEHQRDSSIPDDRTPVPEAAGDAQPPVVTGEPDDEDERDGAH